MAGEVGGALVEEVGGESAVEGFGGIGGEGDDASSETRAAVVLRAAGEDGVDALAVVGGEVLDVADVLEASFDLETADAGIHHRLEVSRAIHVAEREEVALAQGAGNVRNSRRGALGHGDHAAILVEEVEGQAAELGTLSTVGTASEAVLRGIAASAVADAEGAVDKGLERHGGHGGMDGANVFQRELARQDHLLVACGLTGKNVGEGAVVHLCGGVEGERRAHKYVRHPTAGLGGERGGRRSLRGERGGERGRGGGGRGGGRGLRGERGRGGKRGRGGGRGGRRGRKDAGILGDEGVHMDGGEVVDECLRGGQFLVVEEGVDGDVDACAEEVGVVHELSDVPDAVAGSSTCSEAGSSDVHGVCSVADGFETAFQVAGGGKELNGSHRYRRVFPDRRSSSAS